MICERPAHPAEHVRLAVYHDRRTWGVQATNNPASEAESHTCLYPTASTFALLHIISELFKATKSGADAAGKQPSILRPVIYFSDKVIVVSGRFDDRAEVAIRVGEADIIVEFKLVDYAEVQLNRQSQ